MKYSQAFIYSGLFFLLLGIGDDYGKVIPSDIKIFSGIACIVYGILLHFQKNNSFRFEKLDFNWKVLNSKIYFIVGILLIKIENFSDFFDGKFWLTVWLGVIGMAFLCYGLNLHFKEKKDKRESGNIEKNQ